MEQTLYQFNVSGRNELHQYWQSRVAMYASRLGSKARDVQAECHRVFEVKSISLTAISSKLPTLVYRR